MRMPSNQPLRRKTALKHKNVGWEKLSQDPDNFVNIFV
jgi:hypothetical protein